MDEPLYFRLDFENISRPQIVKTLSNEATEETNPYIETELKGSKVYVCTFPDCNKAFRYQSQANRHSIVHNKDRPYPCTFRGCNKSFKRVDILETHMQLHTDNSAYVCDESGCNKKFASERALKRHQVRHSNNSGVKCHVEGCGKSFLQDFQLRQHIKIMHTDDLAQAASTPEEEEEDHIDPEMEKEFQELLDTPYNRAEFEILISQAIKRSKTEKGQEICRLFTNYIANQMRILKEQVRNTKNPKEVQKPIQVNNDNFTLGSIIQNSFSDLARFSEHLDSNAMEFIDWVKESTDNAL